MEIRCERLRGRRRLRRPSAIRRELPGLLRDRLSTALDALSPPDAINTLQDFICNWIGNKQWVDVLPWHGAASWAAAAEAPWTVGGVAAGTVKQAGELSFVRVYNAGHMVPMDAPRNALAMITAFSRGRPLADAPGARAPQRTAWALRRGLPDDRAAAEQ